MSKQNKMARKLAEGREHSARRVAERAKLARKAAEEKALRERMENARPEAAAA